MVRFKPLTIRDLVRKKNDLRVELVLHDVPASSTTFLAAPLTKEVFDSMRKTLGCAVDETTCSICGYTPEGHTHV
jgi:hypothetical protein